MCSRTSRSRQNFHETNIILPIRLNVTVVIATSVIIYAELCLINYIHFIDGICKRITNITQEGKDYKEN
jgi:hypothetical protein